LIEEGGDPVSIPKPDMVQGKDFKAFLVAKGILHKKAGSDEIEEPIGALLKDAPFTMYAFYFTNRGPFLMMINLEMKSADKSGKEVGVIAELTGDSDLEQLFVVKDARARVVCSTKGSFEVLHCYAASY
jgi:hypothetical protein